MKRKGFAIVALGCLWLVPALGAQDNYRVVDGPERFYYGHVSLVEILNDGKDPVVLRQDAGRPLPAVLNFPLQPGDTVRTSDARRLEIQFDNATIVRLDLNTELRIDTILAQSLSRMDTSVSNLSLVKGRIYVMYKEYDRRELFQILTPNAAVKFRHNSVATIAAGPDGTTDIQVAYGKATALFGPDKNKLFESTASKNERLVIDKKSEALSEPPSPEPDFAAWNASINANFRDLHEGKSVLPKPILRGVTRATFYFAQTFGDRFGEWLYDDLYGYVWRPFFNDSYPQGQWRPYYYGQWVAGGGQMFWIPSEPWGWVPYHLGVWQWDAKRGWLWLPGSAFAPAWVDWAYMRGDYFAWSPWTMFDWMFYDGWMPGGWMDGYANRYYGAGGFWNAEGRPGFGGTAVQAPLTSVTKDQLKKPAGTPALSMPKEYRRVLENLRAALKRGDARAIEGLGSGVKPAILVRDRRIDPPLPVGRSGLAETALSRSAPRSFTALSRMIAPLVTRVRDWNPDVRLGQRLGVNIQYSSRTNEVVCPELRLSSAMIGRGVLMAEPRLGRASGGLSGPSSGGSGGSMAATGTSSSGSATTGSSSGGGHIR